MMKWLRKWRIKHGRCPVCGAKLRDDSWGNAPAKHVSGPITNGLEFAALTYDSCWNMYGFYLKRCVVCGVISTVKENRRNGKVGE